MTLTPEVRQRPSTHPLLDDVSRKVYGQCDIFKELAKIGATKASTSRAKSDHDPNTNPKFCFYKDCESGKVRD